AIDSGDLIIAVWDRRLHDGATAEHLRVAPGDSPGLRRAERPARALERLGSEEGRSGGGSGIRTHGGLPHTRSPGVPIRPLSHPSGSTLVASASRVADH